MRLGAQRSTGAVARTEATDAELLQAIGRRSEPAFEELRRRCRRAVERPFRSIVGPGLADCVHEVVVGIWRKAPLYDRGRGRAPAWPLTLVRRTALRFRQRALGAGAVEQRGETGVVEAPDVDRLWLDAALERLPRPERRVIELAYFDASSQSRIAAELAVLIGSVRSRTRRAPNRLAGLLGEADA
jgi:RNA polymerase sigma-70 factor (ECF subfamily)